MNQVLTELVGNVREDYSHQPRGVNPSGLFVNPLLILKIYYMKKKGKDIQDMENSYNVKKILEKELGKGKIDPLNGVGFTILSEDMLNVAVWDTEYPIVIKNQIYSYEYKKIGDLIRTAKKLDIREVGSFCIWELGIVNHEKEAWKQYLKSQHTEQDKLRYLNNFIEGDL